MTSIAETIFKIAAAGPYTQFAWGYLVKHESSSIRDIHDASKVEDWWPIKAGLDELKLMGLVEERDEIWSLTDLGRKVGEVQRTVSEVRAI